MSKQAPRVQHVSRPLSRYERVVFAAVVALTIGGMAWEFSRISANRRKPVTAVETVRQENRTTETASATPGVGVVSVQ